MSAPIDRRPAYVLAVIILGIIYGTLFPLSNWTAINVAPWQAFFTFDGRPSYSDIVVNVLVYVPLGIAIAFWVGTYQFGKSIAYAIVIGCALSLSLELLQAYIPNRVTSIADFALNTFGAILGALFATTFSRQAKLGHFLTGLRTRHCKAGELASFGLLVLGLWAISQLLPFVPSLDFGNLKNGVKPIAQTLAGTREFNIAQTLVYLFSAMSLSIIARACLIRSAERSVIIFGFLILILALKVLVVGRQLSLEAVIGVLAGFATFRIARALSPHRSNVVGMIGIILATIIAGQAAGLNPIMHDNTFNWIPFKGHVTNDLIGIADLFEQIWPMFALAFFMRSQFKWPKSVMVFCGSIFVAGLFFWLEWSQRSIIGRLGDITDVVFSTVAFILPFYLFPNNQPERSARKLRPRSSKIKRKRRQRIGLATTIIAFCFAVGAYLSSLEPATVEGRVDESKRYDLPPPQDLPAVTFEHFNYSHPRLPKPSKAEIQRILEEDPKFVRNQISAAAKTNAEPDAVIFAEVFEPGSQDLGGLLRQLLGLNFLSRGEKQTKPIILAYDWLFHSWTPSQRLSLLNKTLDGCEFVINVIRQNRLSPYNVSLYNSPLQTLVACGLATYGDSERAEPVMRFTHDLWKRRVAPVWRQVMGNNGGWHEGGEYVGLGIGQAIYQVPNMWRAVTGENEFKSVPGIQGFLDFQLYRTRPDGTLFRWGDASYFGRAARDTQALANEFRHRAAYSSPKCPHSIVAGTWPWGSLTDQELCDPEAKSKLPWNKLFDGLGLTIARSDWSERATYVTFKAGDNFWSHSHLDQGSFTIFKRAALAIDSGVHGTGYGSAHHMNYAYQTIAHNTITVLDPLDIIPAPKKDTYRSIANDGGQRRIGSGWGIEGAPLDITEWMLKKEIYHTGMIIDYKSNDNFVSVLADITPAYTNQLSGSGTFSHRTKRVKQFIRRFVYDRVLDIVSVYDTVEIEKPQFITRWNMHSQGRPIRNDSGFEIEVKNKIEGSNLIETIGGLTAHIVLPEKRYLNIIGGPGFEFFVDGRNYDENGKVLNVSKRADAEAGEWRVEIQPNDTTTQFDFLVLLFPWATGAAPETNVRCNKDEFLVNCQIVVNGKAARYQFFKDNNEVVIEHTGN